MDNATLLVITLSLMTAVTWGIVDYAGAKATRVAGSIRAAYLAYLLGASLYIALFAIAMRPNVNFDPSVLWYSVAAASINACGLAVFYKGLHLGPVSIVSPLSSFFPLVTTFVLALFFGHSLSLMQVGGIVLVVGGGVVASGLLNSATKANRVLHKGPLFGLAAAGLWGIGMACLAQAVAAMGWQLATLFHFGFGVIAFTSLLPFLKGKERIFTASSLGFLKNKYVITAGIAQTSGLALVNVAISVRHDLAAVAIALSSCYPVMAVILALVKLKESVQPIPLTGAFVGIVGVIVLTLG